MFVVGTRCSAHLNSEQAQCQAGSSSQPGSRMGPGQGRESEEFHAKMPSAASVAKQVEDTERGKHFPFKQRNWQAKSLTRQSC